MRKWPLQACGLPGHGHSGSRLCCCQACLCLPQGTSAASTVGCWAFLTILSVMYSQCAHSGALG